MGFDLEISSELAEKLESTARAKGETTRDFVILAIAEKLARIEHEQWLAENQKEAMRSQAETIDTQTGSSPLSKPAIPD